MIEKLIMDESRVVVVVVVVYDNKLGCVCKKSDNLIINVVDDTANNAFRCKVSWSSSSKILYDDDFLSQMDGVVTFSFARDMIVDIEFGNQSPNTTYAIPSNNGMYQLEQNKYE